MLLNKEGLSLNPWKYSFRTSQKFCKENTYHSFIAVFLLYLILTLCKWYF